MSDTDKRNGPAAPPVIEARRLDPAGRGPPAGEFSYSVNPAAAPPRRAAAPETPRPSAADKRSASRHRTRLRTGKIIDQAGRFVTECLVFDRSDSGSRLRLPAGVALTGLSIQFYDDQNAVLQQADIVWRREREIGVRFRAAPETAESRALAEDMRRRFYAVPR